MRIAVDQDAFEEGVLQIAIDPEGDEIPKQIEVPGGTARLIKSEAIQTAEGGDIYELDYDNLEEIS